MAAGTSGWRQKRRLVKLELSPYDLNKARNIGRDNKQSKGKFRFL